MAALQGTFSMQLHLCHQPHHIPLDRRGHHSGAPQRPLQRIQTDNSDAQRVLSPFDALSEVVRRLLHTLLLLALVFCIFNEHASLQCTEERVKLTSPQPDDEEETWEDLLELEENVWDPTAAGAVLWTLCCSVE